jgi:hypothetical protein
VEGIGYSGQKGIFPKSTAQRFSSSTDNPQKIIFIRLFSVLLSPSSPLAYFLSFPSPLVGEGGGKGALKVRMRSVMRGVMKQVEVSLKYSLP